MRSQKSLLASFNPKKYILDATNQIVIMGRKIDRPSKRLVLHQKNLKVVSAEIVYRNKNKQIEHHVIRINHLPRLNQVRLHTAQLLYPGEYELKLTFSSPNDNKLIDLKDADVTNVNLREFFPCVDEAEAKRDVVIEFS